MIAILFTESNMPKILEKLGLTKADGIGRRKKFVSGKQLIFVTHEYGSRKGYWTLLSEDDFAETYSAYDYTRMRYTWVTVTPRKGK